MKNIVHKIKNAARITAAAGILLSFPTGCTSVKYNLSKSGYGVVKTIDGVARFATLTSVGEKLGVYSDNPQDANYKPKEVYTGKGVWDGIKFIVTSPIGAFEQTFEGIGNTVGGVHGATIGNISRPENKSANEIPYAIERITRPETKNGIITPTIKYGLDKTREFGCVEKEGVGEKQLENRFKGKGFAKLWTLFLGLIPIVNHLGNKSKIEIKEKVDVEIRIPLKDRIYDATGEVLYLIPNAIGGGTNGGAGSGSGGIGGGSGAGGIGGN